MRASTFRVVVAGLGLAAMLISDVAAVAQASDGAPRFVAHAIAGELRGGYQTVVADLNRDGRPDVIALASGLEELLWFENPGWQRHVLATGLNRPINLAVHDIDGDGIPEIALAHGFSTSIDSSAGIVLLLEHGDDPTMEWERREIDRVATTHRLRWAALDAAGNEVLINAPLIGGTATAPDYRDNVGIYWYSPSDWQRRVVTDAEEGVIHGLFISPGESGGGDAVLSASFLGVHEHRFDGQRWVRRRLAAGDPAEWPRSGASEIAVGHLGGASFLATIEPWHGNQVVIYRQRGDEWARQVIDSGIEDGHTLVVADLDGDGRDDVVAGERRGRRSVYVFSADAAGESWSKRMLDDGGMAAAGCAAADLNADERLDVVCIGTATANLKWYENTTGGAR